MIFGVLNCNVIAVYENIRKNSHTGIKKGLTKKFAKSLILLVGREGIEPSTY